MGAGLARLEARVTIDRLAARIPTLRLKDPDTDISYVPSILIPTIRDVGVVWN